MDEKKAALSRVLNSGVLQNSKQLQRVLEFVGAKAIAESTAEVNEHTLAFALFDRAQGFDPTSDTSVRTAIYRLRGKLREYYSEEGQSDPILIEIPKRHYCPVFVRCDGIGPKHAVMGDVASASESDQASSATMASTLLQPGANHSSQTRVRSWPTIAIICTVLLLSGATLLTLSMTGTMHRKTPCELFWSPFWSKSNPTFIYTGTNAVYRLPRDWMNRYSELHRIENHGLESVFNLDPDKVQHLYPDSFSFLMKQDAYVGAAITSLFARNGAVYSMRYGPDISVSDLRAGPTVLIGAFNNFWTLDLTDELRFTFKHDGDTIEEHAIPRRVWSVRPGEDWALISRVLASKTGASLMAVAGIGSAGTQAAGEFVTNPRRIAELVKHAPTNWSKRNIQVVLHTRVVDGTSGSTDVVAVHFW